MTTVKIDGTAPLTLASVKALADVCDQAEDRSAGDVGGGVITARVTGRPGPGWTEGLNVALVTKWERALRRLERLPAATVAVATGETGGPALDVFLAADIRLATPDAQLLVATDGEATWPGMAAYRLVQQAGTARVRRAVLFGVPIPADQARELGIVDELTEDPDAALAAVARLAGELSGKELAIRRQLLFDATSTSFEDAIGSHLAACDRALRRTAAVVDAR
ncbi:enoyl-CoA-hydratase DpgB [Streptomyces sp. NPDC127068]|uniref:enoyl-CoA-hydratase DpgB n=1 Tax=Streptomyces sp. NPDC127068 TaxID=3347127 RepID=UPI00364A1A70